MIIKSNFKDYYDFVPKQYGSKGDPKIIYIRNVIDEKEEKQYPIYIELNRRNQKVLSIPVIDNHRYIFKWCIVCGKYYLLVGKVNSCWIVTWKLWNLNHPTREYLEQHYFLTHQMFDYRNICFEDYFIGQEDSSLLTLSRMLKAPVFIIEKDFYNYGKQDENYQLSIDNQVPNLQELGFDKLIKPEQMYQEISYWVGNKLKEVPDEDPPKSLSNDEKIIAHGFDLKTSFRKAKE